MHQPQRPDLFWIRLFRRLGAVFAYTVRWRRIARWRRSVTRGRPRSESFSVLRQCFRQFLYVCRLGETKKLRLSIHWWLKCNITYLHAVSLNCRSYFIISKKKRPTSCFTQELTLTLHFEPYTGYSAHRKWKLREFLRNQVDKFSKENIQYNRSLQRRQRRWVVSHFGHRYAMLQIS